MSSEQPAHFTAWESDYSTRNALWRGAAKAVPLLPPKTRVLELGCGNGKTAAGIAIQPGVELHALDISPTAVRICKERIAAVDGKAEVKVANGLSLQYPDQYFDVVFAYHYFAHMLNDERAIALKEAIRVLKRGGKLYLKEFGTHDFRLGKGKEVEPATFKRGFGIITHYFTEAEVRNLSKELSIEYFESERWKVTLRGKIYPREMLHATYVKL